MIGEPTYKDIAKINLQLNVNAATVYSSRGNGRLGLLALTVTSEVYTLHSDQPFEPPANPGPTPEYPDNPMQHQIQLATQAHATSLKAWEEYKATDKALKQQLLSAISEQFYKALRNRIVGYTNITTLQILTHLCTTCGKITANDLMKNDTKIKQNYNSTQPFEDLID